MRTFWNRGAIISIGQNKDEFLCQKVLQHLPTNPICCKFGKIILKIMVGIQRQFVNYKSSAP